MAKHDTASGFATNPIAQAASDAVRALDAAAPGSCQVGVPMRKRDPRRGHIHELGEAVPAGLALPADLEEVVRTSAEVVSHRLVVTLVEPDEMPPPSGRITEAVDDLSNSGRVGGCRSACRQRLSYQSPDDALVVRTNFALGKVASSSRNTSGHGQSSKESFSEATFRMRSVRPFA